MCTRCDARSSKQGQIEIDLPCSSRLHRSAIEAQQTVATGVVRMTDRIHVLRSCPSTCAKGGKHSPDA
jgi:hypothetical protein